jgi:hypothetical protein
MVYQVGSPAMLEGKRFFPETGMPIWKSARRSTVLALCEPDPFTVATWMEKSFTAGSRRAERTGAAVAVSSMSLAVPGGPHPTGRDLVSDLSGIRPIRSTT